MNSGFRSRVAAGANVGEAEIVGSLCQRFGDELVYIAEEGGHDLLRQTATNGPVSGGSRATAAGCRGLKRRARDSV